MDGVERGCFDHLRQEQGQIGAADGVVDEGTHGAAPASPIRCHGVCQIPTSVTRPNVAAEEIGLKKAPIASAAFTAGELGLLLLVPRQGTGLNSLLHSNRKWR